MTLSCAVCNKPAEKSSFRISPLPFFTTDQRVYIPGGIRNDEYKSFPLCKNCYTRLQKGVSFIRKHLDFSIAGARGLRFWLIPSLAPNFIKELIEYVESKALYLKNLRSICDGLETIEVMIGGPTEIEEPPFLAYIALFYYLDRQGNMKTIMSADGIYPNRLRKIVKEKCELDKRYPYFALPKFSPNLHKIFFGFPILADFWLYNGGRSKKKELAKLIANIYLASKVNVEYVNSTFIKRIRGELRGPKAKVGRKLLKNLTPLVLKALMTMEFLEKVEVISMNVGSAVKHKPTTDELVKELSGFLNEHQTVIVPGAQRAVCCAGVLTGIILVEQEEIIRSTSFWGRLNRLELNFERVRSLIPQTVEKLRQYQAMGKYKNLVAHILANEISHLDEKEAKSFSNDLISLMFSIGIGEGYLLTRLAKKVRK